MNNTGCRVTGGDFDEAVADVRASQLELALLGRRSAPSA